MEHTQSLQHLQNDWRSNLVKAGKQSLAFSYKGGNSILHRMPPVLKVLLIPVLSILIFYLPFYFAAGMIVFQLVVACILRFSPEEQAADLKPVLYYGIFLYLSSFIARFFADGLKEAFFTTFTNIQTVRMLLKLFCMMQGASILFKTSTILQIREGICCIESTLRRILPVSKKNSLSNTLALFVCFIPMVYKNWEQAKRAWLARGGKPGIRMMSAILPVFFSIGLKQAYSVSRAQAARQGS